MWSWLPALVGAIFAIIKGLFGIDKPAQVTHVETPSPLPPPVPADVLRDLGITSDATGITGGAFPTAADSDRMHHRTHGGDTTRLYSSRPAIESDDERESQR